MKNTHDNKLNTGCSQVIDNVVTNGLCTGCGLCASIFEKDNIKMQIGVEGFLRPQGVVKYEKRQIEIFEKSCPGLTLSHSKRDNYDPIWGPIKSIRTGNSKDTEIHYRGSSGGVISGMCDYLLRKGEVNFVAQIAVSKTDPLANELQVSRTNSDIITAAGSRYAPSAPLAKLAELLSMGEKFVFVGKPCDVAALRQYSKFDDRVNRLIPYMFSFMCAGIPSIHGTHALLKKMGVKLSDLKSFRYRGEGWPGMTRAETVNGQVAETDYNSSWGDVLSKHLQFRCKICPDGTGEFADVVCGDAWYGKDGYPDFTEREGRSLIISRTNAGELLLQRMMNEEALATESLDVNEIKLMQPYQYNRKTIVLGRLFGTWLARRTFYPRYWNLSLVINSLKSNPIDWLRSAVGTFRRAKGEKV